ncbi:hypothetical protein QR680_010680 [Steinernema hermaphroditum]|uniref:Uncharacterized protein n=1 Tax=Steinernema hermaphroditum TaxID=289476 RepID=A0AA39IR69_9BILA|nr:hypothetical protein QR680_010680 [Steinernema hermaphroditum]
MQRSMLQTDLSKVPIEQLHRINKMKSLLNTSATKLITEKTPFDMGSMSPALKTEFTRVRSVLDFNRIFSCFVGIPFPQECFVFDRNGRINALKSIKRAEKHLHPIVVFMYYIGTGLVDELNEAWDNCHGFGQEQLLRSPCLLVAFFSRLCATGHKPHAYHAHKVYLHAIYHQMEDVATYLSKEYKLFANLPRIIPVKPPSPL